jgi:hypothetical protein
MSRHLGEDALLVAAVLLLEGAEDVVHRLADVVPEADAVAQHVRHEAAGAEAVAHGEAPAHEEGGREADEEGVRVEERHARVADVVGPELEVLRDADAYGEHLEVVVEDALRQPRGAGGVDHDQGLVRRHRHARRLRARARAADLALDRLREPGRVAGRLVRAGAEHQHVLGSEVIELTAHPLDLAPQALVHHEQPRLRLVQDSGEGVAAQAGVDAEQREARIAAAAVQREQVEVVVEQHRHVPRAAPARGAEAAAQEVGGAHARVAVLAVGPGALALEEEGLLGQRGMLGAGLDLGAQHRRGIEGEHFRRHAGLLLGPPGEPGGPDKLAPAARGAQYSMISRM